MKVVLILIAVIALVVRLYYISFLETKSKLHAFISLTQKIYPIKYIIPLQLSKYNGVERSTANKANVALYVFYSAFITIITYYILKITISNT